MPLLVVKIGAWVSLAAIAYLHYKLASGQPFTWYEQPLWTACCR